MNEFTFCFVPSLLNHWWLTLMDPSSLSWPTTTWLSIRAFSDLKTDLKASMFCLSTMRSHSRPSLSVPALSCYQVHKRIDHLHCFDTWWLELQNLLLCCRLSAVVPQTILSSSSRLGSYKTTGWVSSDNSRLSTLIFHEFLRASIGSLWSKVTTDV